MTIDVTALLEALLGLLAVLLTSVLMPLLKAKLGEDARRRLEAFVFAAVCAAEKLYGAGRGREKLDYVRTALERFGFTLDPDELTLFVNGALGKLESGN